MTRRALWGRRLARAWILLVICAGILAALQACAPAAAPTSAAPAAAETQPQTPAKAGQPTSTPAQAAEIPTAAAPSAPTATTAAAPAEPTRVAPAAPAAVTEGRQVELEWPSRLRLGDSDVIRLSLVPTKEGYVARAEFPDHSLQTREVPVPRPNGYELYAIARLDGVGFEIAPGGDQRRFVPEGEEVAWRWVLSPRRAGQQRLSIQLHLRWEPGPGVRGSARESQVYARGLNVQVTSFLGLSPAQAATTGLFGLLISGGFLLTAVVRVGKRAPAAREPERLQPAAPNPNLAIDTPAGLALAGEESSLLRGLFGSYARLVIENEFLSGYSGARTFLIRPIRPDGCADAPTIVKLGPRESILQEFENYENFVKDRLPPMTARIQRAPVIVADRKKNRAGRAAVQYTFIAEPGHPPVSLRHALLQTPDPALLLRLFETFGPSWWMQRRPYTFRLGVEYDRLLPPHYVLEPVAADSSRAVRATLVETENPACLDLALGEVIHLQPFRQVELRADGRSYSLVGSSSAAGAGEGHPVLRLRWLAAAPPSGPVTARVVATRLDLLRGWTANFDRFGLPDPFDRLPVVLEETLAGTRSVIHGDLNLENVLVGPGSLVWLIDFAQTREGHPLYDFAHLASELIAHVLAQRAPSPCAYLDLWLSGKDPLLCALDQIAARCLFDPARPREYHLALFMACLGALKYPNLPDLAKHCLYLTAADLVKKIQLSSPL